MLYFAFFFECFLAWTRDIRTWRINPEMTNARYSMLVFLGYVLYNSYCMRFLSSTGVWCGWSYQLHWWCLCARKVRFPPKHTMCTFMSSCIYRDCIYCFIFFIFRADIIDYGNALNLTMYLTNETDYIVWDRVASSISYVRDMLLADATVYQKFQVRRLQIPPCCHISNIISPWLYL